MLRCKAVVDRSAIPCFPCIHVADNNSASKATLLDQELAQKWIVPLHHLKPTFSKNTRARNKHCFGSKRGYLVYAESSSTGDEKHAIVVTNFQEIKAPEWSLSATSSNSPVSESNNMSKCECIKDQIDKQKKFQCVRIYWVLVSLAVAVFWGKNNVIILTPLLLCFFPPWNASCCWIKGIPKLWDAESKVYKKSQRKRLKWILDLLRKILIFVLEGFL